LSAPIDHSGKKISSQIPPAGGEFSWYDEIRGYRGIMTVQLNWPPDVVDRLTEEAQKRGLSLDAYLLEAVLRSNGSKNGSSDELEKHRKRAEAGARILELQKRVLPDPEGLTSRDYINHGRR
jgi:hypothetical protein